MDWHVLGWRYTTGALLNFFSHSGDQLLYINLPVGVICQTFKIFNYSLKPSGYFWYVALVGEDLH